MTADIADTTTDGFLGGRITLVQPREGHRAGLDAALLQACVPEDATGLAVDLGTGVGTVALAVAARVPGLRVVGVERDAAVVACAAAALILPENSVFAARVTLIEADIGTGSEWPGLAAGSADWMLMNPPFDAPDRVSASPNAGKRSAYLAEATTLDAWVGLAQQLLRPRGELCAIHRPAALPDLLAQLGRGFGNMRVLPVHPRYDTPAKRILLRATKASRAPLTLLPALVLHEADGSWTADAARLLHGEAALPF